MTQRGNSDDERPDLATCRPFQSCTEAELQYLEGAMLDDAWVEPGVSIGAASAADVIWLVCSGAVAVRHDDTVSIVGAGQPVSSDGPLGLADPTRLREVESAWIVRFAPRALTEVAGVEPAVRALVARELDRPEGSNRATTGPAVPKRAAGPPPAAADWGRAG